MKKPKPVSFIFNLSKFIILIIGSIISNGDIAKSAILGGAIGIPVAIAFNLYANRNLEAEKEAELRAKYKSNQEEIFENERELEIMRSEIDYRTPEELPDSRYMDRSYRGVSLGNPLR